MKKSQLVTGFILLQITMFAQIPTDSLVLYLSFYNSIIDVSDIHNDIVNQGVNLTNDLFDNPNSATYFNGENSYIQIPSSKQLDSTKLLTISCIIKPNDLGGEIPAAFVPIVSKWYTYINPDSCSYLIFLNGNKINFYVSNGAIRDTLMATIKFRKYEWVNIVCQFDNGTMKIYQNGILSNSKSSFISEINNSNADLQIGGWYSKYDTNYSSFNGVIDEVKIYKKTLNEEAIKELFYENFCSKPIQVYDTINYYVSSPNFEAQSPRTYQYDPDTLISQRGCDSIVYTVENFVYNPTYCTDTIQVYDTIQQSINKATLLQLDFNGTANDLSEYQNKGEVHGAVLTEDRFGNINSAYQFDGIDDYIVLPHLDAYNIDSSNFALSLWINTIDSINAGMIFQMGSIYGKYTPQFWLRANDKSFNKDFTFLTSDSKIPSDKVYIDSTDFYDGNWHHIVAQRSEDSLALYFDAKLFGKSFTTNRNVNDTIGIIIGGQNKAEGYNYLRNFFNGKIDDVRLYNGVLSINDIQTLYKEESFTGYSIEFVTDTIHIMDTTYVTVTDTLLLDIQLSNQHTFNQISIKIYPNPAEEYIFVEYPNEIELSNFSIKIYDLNAKLVCESQIDQNPTKIRLSDLKNYGTYILNLYDENNVLIADKKLIVK